jgi:hypothetical protein
MNDPFFSVIVPIYRVEEYLAECVESILNQSFGDFELILVDDGSPDNCPAICDEYAAKDSRIRVIHKKNGGVSSARNAALDITRGEYILFCDADDYVLPDAFAAVHRTLEEKKYDLLNYGYIKELSEGSGQRECVLRREVTEGLTVDQLVNFAFAWHFPNNNFHVEMCTYAVKSSIIREHGIRFEEKLKRGEDQSFMLHVYTHAGSIARIPQCLYFYRWNPGSAMNSFVHSETTIRNSVFRLGDIRRTLTEKGIPFSAYAGLYHKSLARVALGPMLDQALTGTPRGRRAFIRQIMDWYERALVENGMVLTGGTGRINKLEMHLIRNKCYLLLDLYTRLLALYSKVR